MLEKLNISPEKLEKISSYLEPIKLTKGSHFIEAGKRNDKIGIMSSGLMISTYISDKGKEEVSRIYSKINGNIIISNHESFYSNSISTESIVAIEESTLQTLSRKNLLKILSIYPEFEKIVKEISEISYIKCIERVKEFQSYSAKERIRAYHDKYSELFRIMKKQHLASFLGINRNDFTKYLSEINYA